MALTAEQKSNALLYLGYPVKTLDAGSTHYNKILVDRFEDLTATAETIVGTLLTEIANLRTKFTASTGRALVKKVGDIELNTEEHYSLGKEYKRLLQDLSKYLDIPLKGHGVSIPLIV